MASLEEMASKGAGKLRTKADTMKSNWEGKVNRMIENYKKVGFGPNKNYNYETNIREATYTAPDPSKWREKWLEAMSE